MGGITFDGIASTERDSSIFSGTNFLVGGSVIAKRVNDSNGAIFSSNLGSPSTYGAFVQAGIAGPLLAATGSIVFGTNFSNQNFAITVTPIGSTVVPASVQSGTTIYTVSGVTINGQSGTNAIYSWIAVGI